MSKYISLSTFLNNINSEDKVKTYVEKYNNIKLCLILNNQLHTSVT